MMNFTKAEQSIIIELEKRAGEVLYFQDIAPFFISNSCLQISTYTQTAYIQVGDHMQNALSEYFQLIVFVKKLEQYGVCFSIPYTPLEDNLVQIGNSNFEEYQQHTIADGDLLIQLFQYASKKYVVVPNASDAFHNQPPQKFSIKNIVSSLILILLFMFIGFIGYKSIEKANNLQLKQDAIGAELQQQTQNIGLISDHIQNQAALQKEIQTNIQKEYSLINNSLEEQNKSLRSIRYWNRKQFDQLEEMIQIIKQDSVN